MESLVSGIAFVLVFGSVLFGIYSYKIHRKKDKSYYERETHYCNRNG